MVEKVVELDNERLAVDIRMDANEYSLFRTALLHYAGFLKARSYGNSPHVKRTLGLTLSKLEKMIYV